MKGERYGIRQEITGSRAPKKKRNKEIQAVLFMQKNPTKTIKITQNSPDW